ncbi:MAG TPA: AI-2E family transporter [Bacteroidetes bacterium]|nr:AI-2E family transporter [Bacteroidota bacterium]
MKNTNKILAFVLGALILYFVYAYMLNILAYILVAWVLSMMGSPIMNFFLVKLKFNKIKIGDSLSAIIVMLIYVIVFSLFFVIILPPVLNQIDILTHLDYSKVFAPFAEPISSIKEKLIEYNLAKPEDLNSDSARKFFINMIRIDSSNISTAFSSVVDIASSVLIGIFSIAFITFFFLKDSKMFSNIITSLVPEKYIDNTQKIIDEVSTLLRRYFSGIALQIIILMTFVFTVLTLLGIKDALIIAFFAAIINVIPYIGPIIGAAFGIFIVLTNNLDMDFYDVILVKLVKIVVTFMTMQMLDNYILQPFIYSDKVKAHPLEIFIVILVGAKIYGIVGMVLAIPVYIVLRAIAGVFFSNYRAVQKITKKK